MLKLLKKNNNKNNINNNNILFEIKMYIILYNIIMNL